MIFLLAFILPFAFLLYSVFSKDVSGTFTAFLLGTFAGLIAIIVSSFFPLENIAVSPFFWVQALRIFLQHFLSIAVLGLFFFFLLSASISGEAVDTSFSALFGIFSASFVNMLYRNIAVPAGLGFMLFLLIIIGAVLIFDFAFNILIANIHTWDITVYLIAFIPFVLVCFLGSIALASWFFNGNPIFYIIMPISICTAGALLNAVSARL